MPPAKIEKCAAQITATKLHDKTGDTDTDIFTDTDLCILGKDWEAYSRYSAQVREEYKVYPDFVYNPGRKKVLNHFLQMERIFKTGYFFNLYESQARKNIRQEVALL
ncbi:MAG TPA: hypothetical protein VG738_07220 [Chitinophagaceae bacterium]|nr:hypothetical protein [Chitinophagaceae bacterium]